MRRINSLLKPRWKIGCLVLVLLPVLCWLSMFLYAKLAGQWAAEKVLPVLPDATLVSETISDTAYYGYRTKLTFYTVPGTLVEIRGRLKEQHVPMGPMDDVLKAEDMRYCSLRIYPLGGSPGTDPYGYLWIAASLSFVLAPVYSTYEFSPDCFHMCVFKTAPIDLYPDIPAAHFGIPDGSVGVSRQICWPMW